MNQQRDPTGPAGITRRGVLRAGSAAALSGTLGCTGAREPARARARGVVLLVADDLGRRDLGAYGNSAVATPALDGLARAGARLDRVYTTAALCRPSRTSLQSGLYPHNTGRSWFGPLREDLPMWPEHFRAGGVATGTFGKTAVTKHRPRWDLCEGGELGYGAGRDPASFGAATRRFLDLAGERPFAFLVNFYDPHRTNVAAAEDPSRLSATRAELARIEPPPNLPATDEVLVELRNYHRDVERMDAGVAAVLEALEERGLTRETLVTFTSDNGADFPFAKATLFEAGVNMPCIVRWPEVVASPVSTRALVSFVDFLPTFMEALGLPAPDGIDGRSFRPLLEGFRGRVEDDGHRRDLIFCEHDEHRGETATPSRAVIDEDHKYVRHFHLDQRFESASMRTVSWRSMVAAARSDPALAERMRRLSERPRAELYDLREDPWELVDRAGDPALAQVERRLAARLREWMRAEGDALLAAWDA